MDLINHLLPKDDRVLSKADKEFEAVAQEYISIFGAIPYGLEFPDITIELLKQAIKDDIEIQPRELDDDEVA